MPTATLGILALAVVIRVPWISQPLLNSHNVRQTQTAMQARNLARDHFDILHMRVDWLGDSPGYMALEFPVYQGVVAAMYAMFGESDTLAKGVSLVSFALAVGFLSGLLGMITSTSIANWATAWFAIAPLTIFASLAAIPDMTALMLNLGALFWLAKWADASRMAYFVAAVAFTLLAFLAKSVAGLPLAGPVAYLLWRRFGRRFPVHPLTIVYGLIVIAPVAAWTLYTADLNARYNNPEHMLGPVLSSAMGTLQDRLSPATYGRIAAYFGFWVLGGVGALLAFVGLVATLRRQLPGSVFILWWMAGLLGYYAIYTYTIAHHSYYQLPTVPVLSFLVGAGVEPTRRWIAGWTIAFRRATVTALAIASAAWWWVPVAHSLQLDDVALDAALAVKAHTQAQDLIVVAAMHKEYASPVNYRSYPTILYYADRRGWVLAATEFDHSSIEALRRRGARYLLVTNADGPDWLSRLFPPLYSLEQDYVEPRQDLRAWVPASYNLVERSGHYALYALGGSS